MEVIIAKSYEEVSQKSANYIAAQLILNKESVLGLATGSTPIRTYELLVKKYKEGIIDFSNVKSFNLDEYVGLDYNSKQSYHYFMQENLFSHINIEEKNINIPNGLSEDIKKECLNYERLIKNTGGIDLQLLGIGRNGHIGFNEPNVRFEAKTHLVSLDEDTIKANARFFDEIAKVPTKAISMGIKTIMMSKKILLIASGEEKAEAIKGLISGPIIPSLPASILQLHRNVTIIVDKEAGKLLDINR